MKKQHTLSMKKQPRHPLRIYHLLAGALALSLQAGELERLYSFTQETKLKGGFREWNGRWYFTAEKGGDHGSGYIGRFDPVAGTLTPIHSFTVEAKPKGPLVQVGEVFYLQGEKGSTQTGFGWIGRFDPATGQFTEVAAYNADLKPKSGLVPAGGFLWLATEKGGTGSGSLDRFDPSTGVLTNMVNLSFETGIKAESFAVGPDGTALYMAAREGGDAGQLAGKGAGTLLRLQTATGELTRLAVFRATEHGAKPRGLTLHGDRLWMVMEEGGDLSLNSGKGGGTIAYFDLSTGTLSRVHVFDGTPTGQKPRGLARVGDDFYFVTEAGGLSGYGVFGVLRQGTVVEVLAELTADTGAKPDSFLTVLNHRIVFSTELGGANSLGSILAWSLPSQPPVPPELMLTRTENGKLRLSWPDPTGRFVLQQTSALGFGSWQDWPGTPELHEGRAAVELAPEAAAAFFRLRNQ